MLVKKIRKSNHAKHRNIEHWKEITTSNTKHKTKLWFAIPVPDMNNMNSKKGIEKQTAITHDNHEKVSNAYSYIHIRSESIVRKLWIRCERFYELIIEHDWVFDVEHLRFKGIKTYRISNDHLIHYSSSSFRPANSEQLTTNSQQLSIKIQINLYTMKGSKATSTKIIKHLCKHESMKMICLDRHLNRHLNLHLRLFNGHLINLQVI